MHAKPPTARLLKQRSLRRLGDRGRYLAIGLVMNPRLTWMLIGLLVVSGCATTPQKQRSPEMIIAAYELLGRGETVDVWRDRMEREGFDCEMIEDGTFTTTHKEKRRIDNADFLRCSREVEDGTDIVALIVENEAVIDSIIDFEAAD